MRQMKTVVLVVTLLGTALLAQSVPDVSGHWEGDVPSPSGP